MQRCALRLSRAAAGADVHCLPYHVPSLVKVAEGVYGASRAGSDLGPDANVAAVLGPAIDDEMWHAVTVSQVVAAAGWRRVTVDAFALACNARAPRFWSRFIEPGAELFKALCAPEWTQSVCPACGLAHREVLYNPAGLVGAGHGRELEGVRGPRGICGTRVTNAPSELAVFACDFGRIEPRPGLPALSDCPVRRFASGAHRCWLLQTRICKSLQ